ncbi:hypothetical protein FGL97_01715 [Pseudomonas putida]|nr:hypothetical protein [Pseudomonas putida]NVN66960.1 hypothetical protein [Pseudomonas putida]
MDTHRWFVGAGSPAKGPGLLANLHPPFTVAVATVFAGKPAPTHAQAVVGAGSPAKGPALLANLHPPFTVAAATVFAGNPLKDRGNCRANASCTADSAHPPARQTRPWSACG